MFELCREATEEDASQLTTNRRTSEHNAKLFGFAELGRDSTMSESKLSPLCSLLPRLSIVEREGGKPKVNRAQNDARISSAEVRRKKTIVNPQQAYRYLDRFKGIDFVDKFYNVEHTQPFEDVVEDLALYCRNNGGQLA